MEVQPCAVLSVDEFLRTHEVLRFARFRPEYLNCGLAVNAHRYGGDVHSCPGEDGRDGRCELEELEIYSNKPYLVNITAVNALGSASRVVSFIVEDIGEKSKRLTQNVTMFNSRGRCVCCLLNKQTNSSTRVARLSPIIFKCFGLKKTV